MSDSAGPSGGALHEQLKLLLDEESTSRDAITGLHAYGVEALHREKVRQLEILTMRAGYSMSNSGMHWRVGTPHTPQSKSGSVSPKSRKARKKTVKMPASPTRSKAVESPGSEEPRTHSIWQQPSEERIEALKHRGSQWGPPPPKSPAPPPKDELLPRHRYSTIKRHDGEQFECVMEAEEKRDQRRDDLKARTLPLKVAQSVAAVPMVATTRRPNKATQEAVMRRENMSRGDRAVAAMLLDAASRQPQWCQPANSDVKTEDDELFEIQQTIAKTRPVTRPHGPPPLVPDVPQRQSGWGIKPPQRSSLTARQLLRNHSRRGHTNTVASRAAAEVLVSRGGGGGKRMSDPAANESTSRRRRSTASDTVRRLGSGETFAPGHTRLVLPLVVPSSLGDSNSDEWEARLPTKPSSGAVAVAEGLVPKPPLPDPNVAVSSAGTDGSSTSNRAVSDRPSPEGSMDTPLMPGANHPGPVQMSVSLPQDIVQSMSIATKVGESRGSFSTSVAGRSTSHYYGAGSTTSRRKSALLAAQQAKEEAVRSTRLAAFLATIDERVAKMEQLGSAKGLIPMHRTAKSHQDSNPLDIESATGSDAEEDPNEEGAPGQSPSQDPGEAPREGGLLELKLKGDAGPAAAGMAGGQGKRLPKFSPKAPKRFREASKPTVWMAKYSLKDGVGRDRRRTRLDGPMDKMAEALEIMEGLQRNV